MKVPLEPIPKESTVQARGSVNRSPNRAGDSRARNKAGFSSDQLDKVYPWLFSISITVSAVLCWLYVTKPVIVEGNVSSGNGSPGQAMTASTDTLNTGLPKAGALASGGRAALIPSDSVLPGGSSHSVARGQAAANDRSPRAISPAMLSKAHDGASSSPFSPGWESTNLKVQHILSVDAGGGDLEKVVLNVPVLYKTRTLRWAGEDITKARSVMKRLMEYEHNLNKLRGEGQSILKDWNEILEATAPTEALRADSPSLPYNHGHGSEAESLPDSSSAIKLEP